MLDPAALQRAFAPMREAMARADAERAATVVEGRAGGGAVVIRISGDLQVKSVSLVTGAAQGDAAMLEDLVSAALSDALRQHRQRFGTSAQEQLERSFRGADLGGMAALLGGLGGR